MSKDLFGGIIVVESGWCYFLYIRVKRGQIFRGSPKEKDLGLGPLEAESRV
jgi:hypothetical protein